MEDFAREPRLPTPEPYAGEPGTCRSFISQCSLIFQLQPSSFSTNRLRLKYIITLLAGREREWGTALWKSGSPTCFDVQNFTAELIKVFDCSLPPASLDDLVKMATRIEKRLKLQAARHERGWCPRESTFKTPTCHLVTSRAPETRQVD